ncbi:hypothetical protein PPACK8108_LOCUS21238 [Phakopsora pachyrhizi]|uniref:Uncharacterized protein n=1 Tax=Phakopsora pachyrhizi TaxID=170000 RepID=A0AAV0BI58_PHAPC|nr:hypothetical protein PPACK8108_LOCUS21238 [Phakopsora pachyrhizi]
MINHTNRDKDDDCQYNTVRSQANSTLNVPSFPPVPTDTTVYDMAHDKPFLNWSSHLPPSETSHTSQKSWTKEDRRNNSASGYKSLNGQSSSSHLSHTTGKSLGINVNSLNPGDEIDKLKSQLAIAFSEVEWLETQLKVQDKGLQKCSNVSTTSINHINGANMIDLSPHGLKGPEELVPIQKRILICLLDIPEAVVKKLTISPQHQKINVLYIVEKWRSLFSYKSKINLNGTHLIFSFLKILSTHADYSLKDCRIIRMS